MSKHVLEAGSRLLLAAVSFAVLAACGHAARPAPGKSPVASTKPYENPGWPVASVADPTRLGFTGGRPSGARCAHEAICRQGRTRTGISYALVKDGEVAAFKFHGNQSVGGRPMQEDTLFRIRSTGKTITAVAMMQLWEQGKWKPEDPISKFLPELANLKVATSADHLDNFAPVSRTPTMNELMTHTAGFGYGLSLGTAVDRAYRAQDVLRAKDMKTLVQLVAGIPLVNQPDDRWYYSIAADLQGAIIETITGKKLGDYLEDNIFKPLAMKDTGFWLVERDRARLATVYTRNASTGSLEVFQDTSNLLSG